MKNKPDTAIITCSFSYNKQNNLRLEANIKGINNHLSMDIDADYYFVELLIDNQTTSYPDKLLKKIFYIDVHGTQKNNFLFQKESLLNIGWQKALDYHDYKYFIFIDADAYSKSKSWFKKIVEKLDKNPNKVIQGFRVVRDTEDVEYVHSSIASLYTLDYQTNFSVNSGICWGIHRSILEKGNGFNPYFIDGNGDSGFIEEYCNTEYYRYEYCHNKFHWFHEIKRNFDFFVQMDCVPIDIFHIFHGNKNSRKNYDCVRFAIDCFNKPLKEIITINKYNLLEWYDADCIESKILQQQDKFESDESVFSLFESMNYKISLKEPIKPEPIDYSKKQKNILDNSPIKLKYNLFNPVKIHNSYCPFSYCTNIISDYESRCPIKIDKNKFSLYLESKPEANFFELYLPVLLSWEPFDLSKYHGINFKVKASKKDQEFYLELISRKDKDNYSISKKISYNTNICFNKWKHIYFDFLSLTDHEFDIKQVIHCKFNFIGSFAIELSEIFFE